MEFRPDDRSRDGAVVVDVADRSPASLVHEIVSAVARREGIEATEVPPLANEIDPEALDALVSHPQSQGSELSVEFEFAGYDIVVRQGGDD